MLCFICTEADSDFELEKTLVKLIQNIRIKTIHGNTICIWDKCMPVLLTQCTKLQRDFFLFSIFTNAI